MRIVDKARLRLRLLFRRGRADAEIEMEFRFHLDQLAEENAAHGNAARPGPKACSHEVGT